MRDGSRVSVDVVILEPRWSETLPRVRFLVRKAVAAALQAAPPRLPRAGGTLAVALASDSQVRDLNRAHRGKDAPTNVLSYPAEAALRRGERRALGDIVLALGTLRREAREQRKPLADHLTHLVIHGTLHLLGHDHRRGPEALRMEALERRILAGLAVPDPYASR